MRIAFRCMAIAALTLITPAGALGIDASWLAASSGEWADSANWSSAHFPDNGSPSSGSQYDVAIDATGAPYTVTLSRAGDAALSYGRYVDINSLTVDSADATLRLAEDTTLRVDNGLHVERGTLVLDDGAVLSSTRVTASPEGAVGSGPNRYAELNNVTLATDFTAGSNLVVRGKLTLEDSVLSFASGGISLHADLQGVGEWRLASTKPETSTFPYDIRYYEPIGGEVVVGTAITIRSTGRSVRIINSTYDWDTGGVFVNQGTILAETDGGWFYIEGFRNEGLIRVSNGDYFSASFNGKVGDVQLGSGASFTAWGGPHFDQPVIVGDGAYLRIAPETQATAAVPLTLQAGGEISITPEAIVPIHATGGRVLLGSYIGRKGYTLTELITLPIIGPALIEFSGTGIDLEGAAVDPATLPTNYVFDPSWIGNGTLTGATLPAASNPLVLRNANLDVPATIGAGRVVRLEQQSSFVQPIALDGGRLELTGQWTNTGGLVVNSGDLQLESAGAAPGSIQMNGGRLVLQHPTTLAAIEALSLGAPDAIDIGRSTGNAPSGEVDLEGRTLDLNAWPNTNWTVHSGVLKNGTVVGDQEGPDLSLRTWGRLTNVNLESVKLNGGSLGAGALTNVWATGSVSTAGVVVDSRFDGGLTGGTIRGALQVGGYLRGTVTFDAGSSVSGTAIFGGSSGRGVRDTYRFIDPAYTIPAGFSVVSSTRYDSNMVFDATATALTIEGEITVGYSSFQQDFWSDSVTFNVASLQTHGKTTVTSDGRLYVNGGYWSHSGELQLTGGVIEAADIAIESPGSLYGWGSITGDVTVDGQLTAPAAGKQLRIIGSLTLGEGATTNLILGSDPDSSPLSVEGAATLGGALSVGLSPALLAAGLAIGDRFTIASASSLSGAFDEISASLPWLTLESVDSASEWCWRYRPSAASRAFGATATTTASSTPPTTPSGATTSANRSHGSPAATSTAAASSMNPTAPSGPPRMAAPQRRRS